MKILVTGAYGQLGSEIRHKQKECKHEFVFASSSEYNLSQTKEKQIKYLKNKHIDFIINCAAYTNVNESNYIENFAKVMNVNYYYPCILAEAALELNIPVIMFSTDYVFDGNENIPYLEDSDKTPLNNYGHSKACLEEYLQGYDNVYIIRTSWVYGHFGKNFVKTMEQLLSTKESIDVVIDQIGSPTYTGDIVDFIFKLIDNIDTVEPGIYNFSNEGVCSWFDFANAIKMHIGSSCKINPVYSSSSVERPNYSVLDKSKVKKCFDIEIPHWLVSLDKYFKLKEETDGNI